MSDPSTVEECKLRIERLKQEAAKESGRVVGVVADLQGRISRLEAENEKLREALRWYGERARTLARSTKEPEARAAYEALVLDAGNRALRALGEGD